MGERRARWGLGYQDKVATATVLDLLRADIRNGTSDFEAIRLADLQAGRVDDFVIVSQQQITGNSLKWSDAAAAVNWGELIGSEGLLRELAEGWTRLKAQWPGRTVSVQLTTNRSASTNKHPSQIITECSVAGFFASEWAVGPSSAGNEAAKSAWEIIRRHTNLDRDVFADFVKSSKVNFSYPEPPSASDGTYDSEMYRRQFDQLHKAIATWITNHPGEESIERAYLLGSIGLPGFKPRLVQRFPSGQIPYERNSESAKAVERLITSVEGGYVAVTGPAGVGKSTLVQDVLSEYPFFIPYFAFLPDGIGNPRDRGDALVFYQDVVGRLDKFFEGRKSLGVSELAQGRDALREHMRRARERFESTGYQTILLIDGLDHVQREPGLTRSLLRELPIPEEVPNGFIIVLSTQPQALLPDAVERHISTEVAPSSPRRQVIHGLSRDEVRRIADQVSSAFSDDDKDALFDASQGNPLILTYLLKYVALHSERNVAQAVSTIAEYKGDIEKYYDDAFAIPLQNPEARQFLALLSRGAPVIPIRWVQTWPERALFESIFESLLAAFVSVDGGNIHFIHNSLIAFLKDRTRSRIPGIDLDQDERRYHSVLADRCGDAPCSDPIGRAKISHLLRSGQTRQLLNHMSSPWLRHGIDAFIPYSELHPIVQQGIAGAWELDDFGEVVRLVLLDFELSARAARMEAKDLAIQLLAVNRPRLAVSHIRSAGRVLVDDKDALEFSSSLLAYALQHEEQELVELSRTIYLQSKPLHLLYRQGVIDRSTEHNAFELLADWADVAPLFETADAVSGEILAVRFSDPDPFYKETQVEIRSALLYRALSGALSAGANIGDVLPFVSALASSGDVNIYFGGLVLLYSYCRSEPLFRKLLKVRATHQSRTAFDLAYVEFLIQSNRLDQARPLCSELASENIDLRVSQNLDQQVRRVIRITRSCQLVGAKQPPISEVRDADQETTARIQSAARQLGELFAMAESGEVPSDLPATLRSLLLFHNRQVAFPAVSHHSAYQLHQAKSLIYGQLMRFSELLGTQAIRVLYRELSEILNGPAASQFPARLRRRFARFFIDKRVISREDAVTLSLSSVADTQDNDPREREEACFDIAKTLFALGNPSDADAWLAKASKVSAGAGSHKDYHMAQLAEWLERSFSDLSDYNLSVLDKFVRAVEVSGGDGSSDALKHVLQLLFRTNPGRALVLAGELIDRDLLNVPMSVESLIIAGSATGVRPELLIGAYSELLTVIHTGNTSEAATSVLQHLSGLDPLQVAERLMRAVRTNTLPSQRVSIGRSLQDVLLQAGHGHPDLTRGLPPGEHDSSLKNTLYRLNDGRTLTVMDMASRLSDMEKRGDWNPNPDENREAG